MDQWLQKYRLVLGQLDETGFLMVLHCWKFFKAQLVDFAVLSGVSPSASLASSWSVTRANREACSS